MADVAEIVFMKPANFTVGVDVYKGTRRISFRRNAPEYYNYIPEGSLQPTRQEQIESDRPPVEGTIVSSSAALLALVGTTAATATVAGVDAADGGAVTLTLTNPQFKQVDGGGERRQPGDVTVAFEATAIAIA